MIQIIGPKEKETIQKQTYTNELKLKQRKLSECIEMKVNSYNAKFTFLVYLITLIVCLVSQR